MKPHAPGARRSSKRRALRPCLYVDLAMCGGELFLEDFDLEEFCQTLQRFVPNVRVQPVLRAPETSRHSRESLVSQAVFDRAIRQYCGQCTLNSCPMP